MRGATSKDGKLAGNRQMVDRYDQSKGGGAKAEPKGDAMDAGEKDHAEIKDVVAQHGPAHTHIHTKEGGKHHSETHHADGHVHHADHDTGDEAREHDKEAMDEDGEMGEHAEPDGDEGMGGMGGKPPMGGGGGGGGGFMPSAA